MSQALINQALLFALESQLTGSAPIAWPNIPFENTDVPMYMEPTILPAVNEGISIQGGAVMFRGIFQVDVVILAGSGSQAGLALADVVTKRLPENYGIPTAATGKTVYLGVASVYDGIQDGSHYRIPVSIPYSMCA